IRLDYVLDVNEVTRLLAVAEDGGALAAEHLAHKDGDHGRVLARRILPRAVDVEVAEADRFEAEALAERLAVVLAGDLRRGVGRQGVERVGLALHRGRIVAIAGARGGEYHPANTRAVSGREDVHR